MRVLTFIALPFLVFAVTLPGQQTATTVTAVPRLVRLSSSFHPANGSAPAAVESATLTIYADETGGTALWQETQNVPVDTEGRYSVLLGSTRTDGLPLELFTSGEPRWFGVQFNRAGEAEQPRVLMASVPYALKAADAETLGGQPASAYVLAAPADAAAPLTSTGTAPSAAAAGFKPEKVTPKVNNGTANNIAKFTNTTDLVNSVMVENNGMIGLGTPNPLDLMHVRFTNTNGGLTGYAVQNLGSDPSSYSGMLFYDQNGALGLFQGYNNSSHVYRINNVARDISNNFNGSIDLMIGSSPKLIVSSNGNVDISGSLTKNGTLFLHNLGTHNTAVGLSALYQYTGGSYNTAIGDSALAINTYGSDNTASGASALVSNQGGGGNTATGAFALYHTVTGSNNTATGYDSLFTNVNGSYNTASGSLALYSNQSGTDNTAMGADALYGATGSNNTAVGSQALQANSAGYGNTAVGMNALTSATGIYNLALVQNAGLYLKTGDVNVLIANAGMDGESNTTRIGTDGNQTRTFISGIRGVMTASPDAMPVMIDSKRQLGTANSSRRFKEDIQDMQDASSGLLRLRPVTYRYKQPYADGSKPLDYGLIAEEVAEVYPDLVIKSKDGEIETVQYQKLTPMLLNELQKVNEKNRSLEARIAALEALLFAKAPSTPTDGQ